MAVKTFLQLCQDSQIQVDDTSATALQIIKQGINESYSEICGLRDWKLSESDVTISSIQGTDEYTPVTNSSIVPRIRRIESVKDETGNKYLDYIQREVFEKTYPHVDTTVNQGTPLLWYISGYDSNHDIKIKLYYVPDGQRTYRITYYEEPLELINDSDIPNIPDQYQQNLTYLGMARYYEWKKDSFASYYRQMHESYKGKILTAEYSPYDQMPQFEIQKKSNAFITGKIGRVWNR